jgi:hypothetical protein
MHHSRRACSVGRHLCGIMAHKFHYDRLRYPGIFEHRIGRNWQSMDVTSWVRRFESRSLRQPQSRWMHGE